MTTPLYPSLDSFDCIIFDMDGTLAPSKGVVTTTMAQYLDALLTKKIVAVISGGAWEQFETQLIPYLKKESLDHLVILPTSGTALYRHSDSTWKEVYREVIPPLERKQIIKELERVLERVGYHETDILGEIIEDRESQITFSGLGSKAPIEKKIRWDPDQKKRTIIASMLRERIPAYTITIGGATSVDITRSGVDKAYGVRSLSKTIHIPLEKMLFVGDKLAPGGNDYPVVAVGIKTVAVVDEHETERLLEYWCA